MDLFLSALRPGHLRPLAGKLQVDQFQKLSGINRLDQKRRQFAGGKQVNSVLDFINRHS